MNQNLLLMTIITMNCISNIEPDCGIIIHVTGKVQGVGFRFFTYQKAQELNLVGYVKNLANGSVEILAHGEFNQINKLIQWLKLGGPTSAIIAQLRIERIEIDDHYTSFNVKY